jgi:hypothetical protein
MNNDGNNSNDSYQQYQQYQQSTSAPGQSQYYNEYGFPANGQAQATSKPQQVVVVKSPDTSGFAILSLIIGILGLLGLDFFGVFIIGLICGHVALIKIKFSQGQVGGRGIAIAGLILNYIPVVVIAGMMLLYLMLHGVMTR